jgi:predicted ATPase/DNA-binding SARP family transcriptional activator
MIKELRLHLLGGHQITLGNEVLSGLALAKARALLFYLAVTRRCQPRVMLTDLLWSELPPEAARRNLRVALTRLRSAAGDHLLVTRGEIGINPNAPCWTDVEAFVAQTNVQGGEPGGLLPAEVAGQLAAGLERYQGDFLYGFEVTNAPLFEEWMLVERERLRQRALYAGGMLAGHYYLCESYARGIDLCRRLLAIEPSQESIHQHLIRLLAANGQRTAALQQYEQCRHLVAQELGVEPEPATVALVEQIRSGAFPGKVTEGQDDKVTRWQGEKVAVTQSPSHPITQSPPHNLPAPTTPFLGRTEELGQIAALLGDPACRLLTLLGVGGVGKTRLAVQAAQQQVDDPQFSSKDGVFFVSLAAASTINEAIPLIIGALGEDLAGKRDPKSQLLGCLQTQQMLLVLDNFEQLAPEAAVLSELLQAAPGLKLLVTSRERLNLYEEWLLDVRGLLLPPPHPQAGALRARQEPLATRQQAPQPKLEAYSAVQLFAQRARRLKLDFDLDVEAAAVVHICRLLEGLPLGIELAAGWVRTYRCAQIAQEIERDLDFLSTTVQNVPARHRSLAAAFDHSWRLLDAAEARLFRHLTAFRGSFDETAAQAVAGASPLMLAQLADKSLLQRLSGSRYVVHELLRQFGAEKLSESERYVVGSAHSRYYAALVAARRQHQATAHEPAALAALQVEYENIRSGWQWTIGQIQEQAVSPVRSRQIVELVQQYTPMLAYFLLRQGRYREGQALFTQAAQVMLAAGWQTGEAQARDTGHSAVPNPQSPSPLVLAQIRSWQGEFAFHLSQFAEVESLIAGVLPIFERVGAWDEAVAALSRLGAAYLRMGRYTEAEATLREGLAYARRDGDPTSMATPLNLLGNLYGNQGRFEEGRACHEQCLAIYRASGYQRGIANILNNLGSNFARSGQPELALPLYQETYDIALAIGERQTTAVALSNLGSVSRSLGRYDDARRYYGESLVLCRALGDRRWVAAGLNGLGLTLVDAGELDEAAQALRSALAIAWEIQSTPDALDALAALGEILVRQEELERALVVLHFVVAHRVTQTLARQRSEQVLAQVARTLPVEMVETAQIQARQVDLEQVVMMVAS